MSIRLGLRGWPNAAEDLIVSRNVILSTYTGAHIHMQHISSALSVEILRQAKAKGVRVTAEATPAPHRPHRRVALDLRHELQDEPAAAHRGGPAGRSSPGLRDGTLDCIATDHAPHTDYEKDKEFDYAPNGILGLETALAVVARGPGAREQVQALRTSST